jgi:hypothetical protein
VCSSLERSFQSRPSPMWNSEDLELDLQDYFGLRDQAGLSSEPRTPDSLGSSSLRELLTVVDPVYPGSSLVNPILWSPLEGSARRRDRTSFNMFGKSSDHYDDGDRDRHGDRDRNRPQPPDVRYNLGAVSLPSFSGEEPMGKRAAAFDTWRSALESYVARNFDPIVLKDVIQRSLKGMAATAFTTYRRCHPTFETMHFLTYMTNTFAPVADITSLTCQFYSMMQGRNDDITRWAVDLSNVYAQIREVQPNALVRNPADPEAALRQQFWRGLKNKTVQEALRSVYRDYTGGFTDFMARARDVEHDTLTLSSHKTPTSTARHYGIQELSSEGITETEDCLTSQDAVGGLSEGLGTVAAMQKPRGTSNQSRKSSLGESDILAEILKRICAIEADVAEIKESREREGVERRHSLPETRRGQCFECGSREHYRNECPHVKRRPSHSSSRTVVPTRAGQPVVTTPSGGNVSRVSEPEANGKPN